MVKTVTTLEATDIDNNNKFHSDVGFMLLLSMTMFQGQKKQAGEDNDLLLKLAVSEFLNMVDSFGYTLIKKESVPNIFRDL